jgi:transcriptional regulator with XRE-family HTH domain
MSTMHGPTSVRVDSNAINALRFTRGITQKKLAQMAGIAQPTVSRMLAPHHNRYTGRASVDTLQRVASVLNAEPTQFILPDDAPLPEPMRGPDGEIMVQVAGHTDVTGRTVDTHLRPYTKKYANRKRASRAAAKKRIKFLMAAKRSTTTKPTPATTPTGDNFVHHYEGKASRLLVVNGTDHKIYDLSKVQLFYIK